MSKVKIGLKKVFKSRKFISESAEKIKKKESDRYYPKIQEVINLLKKPGSEGRKSQKSLQISLFNSKSELKQEITNQNWKKDKKEERIRHSSSHFPQLQRVFVNNKKNE